LDTEFSKIPNGTETILLAEDFDSARELIVDTLEQLGYQVLAACDGGQAVKLMKSNQGKIDLLISDMIIPDMDGRELYKRLLSLQPGLKVLFVSGYIPDYLDSHFQLEEGVNFLQKPFSLKEISVMIRRLLDE
jgi:CheY-like chemotaxis protein